MTPPLTLAPASKSPLLATTLPITPKATTESVVSAVPSLDDKVEYMDVDGIPRRSETITRRMVLRGHAIDKALVLNEDEQAHRSKETRDNETKQRDEEIANELRQLEIKQKANADFKRQNKAERQQWIEESDELIVTRLHFMYDRKLAPPDQVDVTEENTAISPSKLAQCFIDPDGNLRRKSAPKIEFTTTKEDSVTIDIHDGNTKVDYHLAASPTATSIPTNFLPS